jgi:hypothetical protein
VRSSRRFSSREVSSLMRSRSILVGVLASMGSW